MKYRTWRMEYRTYDNRGEEKGYLVQNKDILYSLPQGRRDEKAGGSWQAPRSAGSLFSFFSSLCDLCELEREAQATNGRDKVFEPFPRLAPRNQGEREPLLFLSNRLRYLPDFLGFGDIADEDARF